MNAWVSRWFISLLVFFSVSGNSPLRAESVSYSYDLSNITPIWDISETYQEDIDGLSISITLSQDGAGRISGGGAWSGSEEGLDLSATMTVKGSLTRPKGIAKVAYTVQHKGIATDGSRSVKFSIAQKVRAEIDEENLEMSGTIRTSMSMAGQRFSDTEYWSEALPSDMNGTYGLEIESVSGPKGITGSAVMTLSNLRTNLFRLKGSNKKGVSSLRLTGSKATTNAGSVLAMKMDTDSGTIQTLKGKVFGQTISGYSVTGSVTHVTDSLGSEGFYMVQIGAGMTLSGGLGATLHDPTNRLLMSELKFSEPTNIGPPGDDQYFQADFASLRTDAVKNPDSEENRATIEKMMRMRQQRINQEQSLY